MFGTTQRLSAGKTLGVLAVTIAAVGFAGPYAAGVGGGHGGDSHAARATSKTDPGDTVLQTIIRVENKFTVEAHSLSTNQIVRCPAHTKLTGGGTSLDGEPNNVGNAPIVYGNGPVGNILAGEQQSWGSEVANKSKQKFHYVQFALCATTRSIPYTS